MRQSFDNQYIVNSQNSVLPLENNTDFVRHDSDLKFIYKTLLFQMRNVAKTFKTIKETQLQKKPRIAFCGYAPFKKDTPNKFIDIVKNGTSLHYHGVAQCCGYWRCPVCALKISENKKKLITEITDQHLALKKSIGFITLTIRHNKNDTLKGSLDKLLKNYRSFQNQRFFSRGKKDYTLLGQIKTLEITFSELNGWHPHLHLLFFYDNISNENLTIFQKQFIKNWSIFKDNNSLIKSQHQDIVRNNSISDYTSKLDIVSEMTKGKIKTSKGLTPFTALAKLALKDYQNSNEKNLLYGIYDNYIEQTQGRHFVNISNALTKLYNVDDLNLTDEQICSTTTFDAVLCHISTVTWLKICKLNLQPLLLQKYTKYGLDGAFNLLKYYKSFKDLSVQIHTDDIPILTVERW